MSSSHSAVPESEQPPRTAPESGGPFDGSRPVTPLDERTARTSCVSPNPEPPADGVSLWESRLSPEAARRLLGPKCLRGANAAPRCSHVYASGVQCGSPAMRGNQYCYFHRRHHGAIRTLYNTLNTIDDPYGVQNCLMETMRGIVDSTIERPVGALLLAGLRTAAINLTRMPEIDPDEVVTESPVEAPFAPTQVAHASTAASSVAPERKEEIQAPAAK